MRYATALMIFCSFPVKIRVDCLKLKIMIIMSVDVESWVHRQVFNIPLSEQTKELDSGHVLRSTRIILELFRKYNTKATFFVLGTVAEWYPELIDDMNHCWTFG